MFTLYFLSSSSSWPLGWRYTRGKDPQNARLKKYCLEPFGKVSWTPKQSRYQSDTNAWIEKLLSRLLQIWFRKSAWNEGILSHNDRWDGDIHVENTPKNKGDEKELFKRFQKSPARVKSLHGAWRTHWLNIMILGTGLAQIHVDLWEFHVENPPKNILQIELAFSFPKSPTVLKSYDGARRTVVPKPLAYIGGGSPLTI